MQERARANCQPVSRLGSVRFKAPTSVAGALRASGSWCAERQLKQSRRPAMLSSESMASIGGFQEKRISALSRTLSVPTIAPFERSHHLQEGLSHF